MTSFYNLKIATKLLLSFAVILLMSAALGVFSILQLTKVDHVATDLGANWMPSVRVVLEIKSNVARYRTQEVLHILSSDAAEMDRDDKLMADIMTNLQKNMDEYTKLISEPEEKIEFAKFNELWTKYLAVSKKLIQLSREGKNDDAKALIHGDSLRLSGDLTNSIDALVKVNVDGGAKSIQTGAEVYAVSRLGIFSGLIVCIISGILFAIWIARVISRPLNEALTIAKTVAAGDLTSRIDVKTNDETGQLLQALKDMNVSLQNIVGQVRAGTDTIATASSQIASGNLDLSSRTEEQASSIEETASSMEELTGTVKQNADNARQANQMAGSASDVALRGGAVVSQVVETMGSINDSARKIVDIIGVIDGIAFQTNILALNAAVEAARAGEQGRGFAVVASEVRNLAQRSASAAKEIKTLIGDSVEKVDIGSKLVAEAGTTMDEIVQSVKRVTDIMSDITAASQEQTSGIEQINQAITQMDQATQQNAALVEEAAAAAQSMEDQAGNLLQLVSQFKLDPVTANAGARAGASQRVVVPHKAPRVASTVAKPLPSRAVATPSLQKPAKARTLATTPASTAELDWEEF